MKKILLIAVLFTLLFSCKKESPNADDVSIDTGTLEKIDTEKLRIDSLRMVRQDSLAQVRKDSLEQVKKDSLQNLIIQKRKQKKYEVFKGESFSYWPIKSSDSLRKLFYNTFSKQQQYTIAALNRIDTDHLKTRDKLMVRNECTEWLIGYTQFTRKIANLNDVAKIVILSYPNHAYGVYENGNLVKWGPTNMRKQSAQTPRGSFFTNWNGRQVTSPLED